MIGSLPVKTFSDNFFVSALSLAHFSHDLCRHVRLIQNVSLTFSGNTSGSAHYSNDFWKHVRLDNFSKMFVSTLCPFRAFL